MYLRFLKANIKFKMAMGMGVYHWIMGTCSYLAIGTLKPMRRSQGLAVIFSHHKVCETLLKSFSHNVVFYRYTKQIKSGETWTHQLKAHVYLFFFWWVGFYNICTHSLHKHIYKCRDTSTSPAATWEAKVYWKWTTIIQNWNFSLEIYRYLFLVYA